MPQGKNQQNQSDDEFRLPEGMAAALFEHAHKLRERYDEIVKARRANREGLRNLAEQGLLTPDEVAELDDIYPVRTVNRSGDGENAPEGEPAPAAA